MDRLVSFWKISPHKVQYEFNIKCLGSKCTRVAFSPVEPQCYLLNCNDNTLRLWNTGKKTNRFVSTILWKGLDKRGIKEIAFHPEDEALIVRRRAALRERLTLRLREVAPEAAVAKHPRPSTGTRAQIERCRPRIAGVRRFEEAERFLELECGP